MNIHATDTDIALFGQISEGSETAFREIFDRYTPQLHPFILGIVKKEAIAREIVQEVFLRLWLRRETLTAVEKPSSWLYRIASNLSMTWYRRQQMERKILETIGQSETASEHLPEEEFTSRELQKLIQDAINRLPPKRRQIFILSRVEGLSRKEIAQQLNMSENTVRNQLAISLKFIQKFIQQNSGFYIPFLLLLQSLSRIS